MGKQLSPSENEIMRVIWQSGGKTSVAPLLDALDSMGKKWKSNTVVTFLSRLVEKGLLTIEKNGRNNIYIAAFTEAELRKLQTKSFFEEIYGGNVEGFIASLFEQNNLLLMDVEKSKIRVGKLFSNQFLNDENKKNACTTADVIKKALRKEITYRKASINTKRKTIIQFEREIKDEERRMNELSELIDKLRIID